MRRLCLSNLEIELREGTPGALADMWRGYASHPSSNTQPRLVIEVHRVAVLPQERAPGPLFPAFERTVVGASAGNAGAILVDRYDAWGEIAVGTDGVFRAQFTVGPSPNSLEACIRIAISAALPATGGFLMHSSAVELGGQAMVFSGVSGAGKSTISGLLADREGLPKLADELLLVQAPRAGGQPWTLHVTPFLGADGLPHGTSAPLGAVHLLIQAPHHRKTRALRVAALREVMKHILVYTGLPGTADQVLGLVDQLCVEIPVYHLEFELTSPLLPVLADSRQSS